MLRMGKDLLVNYSTAFVNCIIAFVHRVDAFVGDTADGS
jgi:hypothetical protein